MNTRQVPSPLVNGVDQEKHEPPQALTSPRQALASTVLTLNLTLTSILFQRANGHRDHPSKMRAVEGEANTFSVNVSSWRHCFKSFYAVGSRSSRADGRSGPAGTELLRRARSAEPTVLDRSPPPIGIAVQLRCPITQGVKTAIWPPRVRNPTESLVSAAHLFDHVP
jgi:hypothetical protein